ncbi:YozE family protein [Mammaliicoccus stepanovicii]|uniref:Putative cytosolic protein n=1 Tax=Mammaliicoccus stepanovicii TaxID=643214 RepID=A0A239ZFN0_9STAP|nr:YozE family protein [Mammaliicoccus stepanovicii]PNZ79023.1 hypothetical protein CD111_01405 [Mammaliicoccus stepanovicii]GGI41876.1 hypothetical protein GCM10010896_15610 [Mammaliicoccus stepanovicii]SNV70061.1 Putative cytosolic protein [Mammaliicoccus stepanovicii]
MSFYEFIQTFSDDDTPLGELANWLIQDAHFPVDVNSDDEILSYFHKSNIRDNGRLELLKRAIFLYHQYANS